MPAVFVSEGWSGYWARLFSETPVETSDDVGVVLEPGGRLAHTNPGLAWWAADGHGGGGNGSHFRLKVNIL